MKLLTFFFIFLILVSCSYAYDCSTINDVDSCEYLNSINEDLIANIIYTNTSSPNYKFVQDYNKEIIINSPPENTTIKNSEFIKDAWINILNIQPSILYKDELYVPKTINIRTEFNYEILIPSNYENKDKDVGDICKKEYSLESQSETISVYADDLLIGNNKNIQVTIFNYDQIKSIIQINVEIEEDVFRWEKDNDKFRCEFDETIYLQDNILIEDFVDVKEYNSPKDSEFTFLTEYSNTHKGIIYLSEGTNTFLDLGNAYYSNNQLEFYAEFTNKPFYLLQLTAVDSNSEKQTNIIRNNNTIYVETPSKCSVTTTGFFETKINPCKENYSEQIIEPFEKEEFSSNWNLLYMIIVFIIINILLYKVIKKYWGKAIIPVVLLLLLVPSVKAEDCGLTNLASCIPEKMYEYFLQLINQPIEPLLDFTKLLLEAHPDISLFQGVWAIVIYCISLFYGLLFIYSGFQFLFSGHNVIKREMAKEWLKNTVIMIVLIQGSFYLYDLTIELGSIMSSSILSMVDPHFFMITANNLINIGLEFILLFAYVFVLLITLLFLVMRYLIVALGVLFLPIGIFCYFIPPLKSYGKLILNILAMNIFITFLASIIILACSMLIQIDFFQNIKILVMINCFAIVDILFILLTKHIITKSGAGDGADKVAQAVKYIALFV